MLVSPGSFHRAGGYDALFALGWQQQVRDHEATFHFDEAYDILLQSMLLDAEFFLSQLQREQASRKRTSAAKTHRRDRVGLAGKLQVGLAALELGELGSGLAELHRRSLESCVSWLGALPLMPQWQPCVDAPMAAMR